MKNVGDAVNAASKTQIKFVSIVTVIIVVLYVVYILSFQFRRKIKVKRTYTKSTAYYVIDDNDEVYEVSNSLFFWSWNEAELWNSLKQGSEYNVVGYGMRIGFLGMFPLIIRMD